VQGFLRSQVLRDAALVTLAAGCVFLFHLGAVRLWDMDEAIFSETAREMFERGDAVVPWFNGTLFTHKPPWMYWGMMLGYRLLGCNELAARLGSALAGLGTVLLTWAIGRRLFSPRVGFWAGIVLGCCLQFAVIARAATPDAWLSLFTTLAMWLLVRGTFARATEATPDETAPSEAASGASASSEPVIGRTSLGAYALAYVALGVGILVKGPVAIVLPVGVWASFLVSQGALCDLAAGQAGGSASTGRRWSRWLAFASPGRWLRAGLAMRPALAVVVALAVAGPWYLVVGLRTDWEWLIGFFGVHNFGRFLQPMENHGGPAYYYLVALLAGLFPWSIFLSPTCAGAWRRVATRAVGWQGDLLLVCWVGVWVGFFSLAGTKLPSYIAPAYPAAALLTARWIAGWIEAPASVARGWPRSGFAVLGTVGLVTAIGLPLAIEHFFSHAPEYRWGLLAAPLIVAAVAGWIASERGEAGRAAAIVAIGAVLFLCGVLGLGAARVDDYQYTVPLAARIRAESAGDQSPIISYRYMRPSLIFYARQPIVEVGALRDVADFFAHSPGSALLVTPAPEFEQLRPLLPPDVETLETHPAFLKGDPLLLVGRRRAAERPPTENASASGTDAAPRR